MRGRQEGKEWGGVTEVRNDLRSMRRIVHVHPPFRRSAFASATSLTWRVIEGSLQDPFLHK